MAGPGVYRRRREKKAREKEELRLLQQMDAEEWLKDIDRWEQSQGIPYRTYTGARAELHKMATRQSKLEGSWMPSGRGAGGVPVSTPWLQNPAYVPWAAPGGEYGRWGTRQNMGWYAPKAEVADQPWLTTINRLLPYMNPDDQTTMARQLYTAGGGAGGPFGGYLGTGVGGVQTPVPPSPPASPWSGGWGKKQQRGVPKTPAPATYKKTLQSIQGVLDKIPDETARAWARSVFDIYTDMTKQTGMRGSEEEAMFKAQLDEMFASVPESAQPYAAALQRLVVPTVRRPAQEFYEKTAEQRTSPTHWGVAANLRWNPAWR